MNGINILNQTDILTFTYWCGFACILLLISCIVFMLAAITFQSMGCFYTSIALSIFFIMFLAIGSTFKEPTGKYRYEVTIDRTVSFIDMYEKYEIIEQRGNIWVLEDKEMEE